MSHCEVTNTDKKQSQGSCQVNSKKTRQINITPINQSINHVSCQVNSKKTRQINITPINQSWLLSGK